MQLACDRNKSISTVHNNNNNNVLSLTESNGVCMEVERNHHHDHSTLPLTGLLTKYWKSASVLCDDKATESIVHRRTHKVRKNHVVRSCERDSAMTLNQHHDKDTTENAWLNGDAVPLKNGVEKAKNGDKLDDVMWNLFQSGAKQMTLFSNECGLNGFTETHSLNHSTSSHSDGSLTPKICHTQKNAINETIDKRSLSQHSLQKDPILQNGLSSSHSQSRQDSNEETEDIKSVDEQQNDSEKNEEELNKTNLIVNYLPQNMTQEEIRDLFATIGEVDSCKLIKDKNTNQNLGYGFVNYVHSEDAEKAIATLNGMQLQNKTIKVSLARPSSESIKGANLYISGLPQTMTQEELEKLFTQCGRIITSRILYDSNTGLSRGVGFIRFDQRVEAELAIKQLNGIIPPTGTEPITVKLANSPASGSLGPGSFIALNGGLSSHHPEQNGYLDSSLKDAVTAGKQHSSALAMMLLYQLASQSPYNQSGLFPRIPNAAKSPTALLPFPPRCLPSRGPRSITRPLNQYSKRPPLDRDVKDANPNMSFPAHPLSNGSYLHGAYTNPSQMLNAPLATPMFYPRYRYTSHNRLIGVPSTTNGLPINQFLPTTLSTLPTTVPFQTPYPLTDNISTENFYPFSPHMQSASLPFTDMQTLHLGPNSTLTGGPWIPPAIPVVTPGGGYPGVYSSPAPIQYQYPGLFCLFVSNLPPEADDATLWRLFGPYGAVRSVKVVRDSATNRCKGFGFVNMLNYAEALLAIQQLNNSTFGNRLLHVSFKNTYTNPNAPP